MNGKIKTAMQIQILVSVILFLSLPIFALEFSGHLNDFTMIGLKSAEANRFRLTIEPALNQNLAQSWELNLKARGFVDPALWPNSRSAKNIQEDEGYDLELRAASLEYRALPLLLKLGLQEVVWGEALHYFSADILHPKDFRDGFINELSWARRPQAGVLASFELESVGLQLVYFPLTRVHRYARLGSVFSIDETHPEALGFATGKKDDLWNFKKPTLGLNLGLRFEGVEWHLIGALLKDPQGYYSLSTAGAKMEHDLMAHLATTLSYSFDSWLLRAESQWIPQRKINSFESASEISNHPVQEFSELGSVEWSGIENIILSIQFLWNQKRGCEERQILSCRTIQESLKILWMNLPWDLEFESTLWLEHQDPSAWLSTHLRRPLSERVKAEIALEEFVGSGDGIFAGWNDKDQIWFKVDYSF